MTPPLPKTLHVVSISGGKDSTAMLLLALDRCPREAVIPVFCDTGNEHQIVHDYLDYLEQALGITIHRLKADLSDRITARRKQIALDQRVGRDKRGRKLRRSNKAKRNALAVLHPTGNPFLDLCLANGRFPSGLHRFCTSYLKRDVAVAYQIDLIDAGHRVISWQGIRREESFHRRNAKKMERIGPSLWAFRPLVDWTAAQVFEAHKAHGIEPNPLYKQGMPRVGCMPCIHCNKEQIREISARFPEYLNQKSQWETLVSKAAKHGFSTFFHKDISGSTGQDYDIFREQNIAAIIEWSRTGRGGRQLSFLDRFIDGDACSSSYGLCE